MSNDTIISYKGFDANWQCRGYQFKLGESYSHDGEVRACHSGFHACEYPLDVLYYYAPSDSRYALVEQSGDISRHSEDSKVASQHISIKAELSLPALIKAAIDFTFARSKPEGERATGYSGAASATGYSGAASATGYSGAASATGESGAASATGYSGAASATGYSGAASATGYSGAASATGYSGAASATGDRGRVMGAAGCALFLVERSEEGEILHVWAGIAGRNGIKPFTWYWLKNGEPVEVQP